MDEHSQTNHLRAYGIAYAALQEGMQVHWLLNYRGGSFVVAQDKMIEGLCRQRGVSFEALSAKQYAKITTDIKGPTYKGAIIPLNKAPRIAVYTPISKQPWDDAVTMALTYAGIPFEKLYAGEVLAGQLGRFDWLHLHHEDFTGQFGKFWAGYRNTPWYQADEKAMNDLAKNNGFTKVSQLQLAVVRKIRNFVGDGGNLFAMCTATETFDIALAAAKTDICDTEFDGDPADLSANAKLDFTDCLAFRGFAVNASPYRLQHSDIDRPDFYLPEPEDKFKLLAPPAFPDAVPAMLCQNHTTSIKGFRGQTTAFRKETIKPGTLVLGQYDFSPQKLASLGIVSAYTEARYLHGEYKQGAWTFYSGHDPEDYQHLVNDPATNLDNFPHSPGYRLILNNVLFPAAKKIFVPTVFSRDTIQTGSVDNSNTPAQATILPKPDDKVKMYPNPANNELVLSIIPGAGDNPKQLYIERVVISNIAGAEAINQTYHADKVHVSLKGLAPGLYLIAVNGEYIGRMVKE